ncbi:agmatine deiminase family protein [Halosquirtibacter xylanolyticus]|uniref:agmatine deiminase family protein n=1 Tax=Halosquirtibacter xylanolyticus TaxID=3374599 RepID=UPI0037479789|nr:agmatine deiminase family protein [Prolixibacteraceae bacterium]
MKKSGSKTSIIWPAEWHRQSAIQLTWPHIDSDWREVYEEVLSCYLELSKAITRYQPLVIVAQEKESVVSLLEGNTGPYPFKVVLCKTNDTWARDHGGISVFNGGVPQLYDYRFNGWGLKFPSDLDNQITSHLFQSNTFSSEVQYRNALDFVLEGGGIETDGKGSCMVTEACLLSKNRNEHLDKQQIEHRLRQDLGVDHILWLTAGEIDGDDTDSHIDTLARFVAEDTIVYQGCDDPNDDHYEILNEMANILGSFRQPNGEPYRLVCLPWPSAKYDDQNERLPATYANFLIINGAVLVPTYYDQSDEEVLRIFSQLFPKRDVIGVDCSVLIKQHGSLHCVTMQYPEGFIEI